MNLKIGTDCKKKVCRDLAFSPRSDMIVIGQRVGERLDSTGEQKMVIQSYGGGTLNLEKDNDQFFWTRDGERSQNFMAKNQAVDALKNHKLRWVKTKKS